MQSSSHEPSTLVADSMCVCVCVCVCVYANNDD